MKNNMWTSAYSKILIDAFKPGQTFNASKKSAIHFAAMERENGPQAILSRIKHQIIDCYKQNLDWRTPDGWDRCFLALGGGTARRQSHTILSRMTWDEFLKEADKIIKESECINNE